MVATVKIDTSQIEAAARRLGTQAKQIPFAASVAINAVAKKSQEQIEAEMAARFDRLTPWIKKGLFTERATKQNLQATVGIKDQGTRATPHHYLRDHVTGGTRGAKPYELVLQSLGILPPGWLTIPVPGGIKLDAYGNISKATLKRIIDGITNRRAVSTGLGTFRLIVAKPGQPRTAHLAPGIWSVSRTDTGNSIQPVLLFIRSAAYNERLDLHTIVSREVAASFNTEFATALARALETAR